MRLSDRGGGNASNNSDDESTSCSCSSCNNCSQTEDSISGSASGRLNNANAATNGTTNANNTSSSRSKSKSDRNWRLKKRKQNFRLNLNGLKKPSSSGGGFDNPSYLHRHEHDPSINDINLPNGFIKSMSFSSPMLPIEGKGSKKKGKKFLPSTPLPLPFYDSPKKHINDLQQKGSDVDLVDYDDLEDSSTSSSEYSNKTQCDQKGSSGSGPLKKGKRSSKLSSHRIHVKSQETELNILPAPGSRGGHQSKSSYRSSSSRRSSFAVKGHNHQEGQYGSHSQGRGDSPQSSSIGGRLSLADQYNNDEAPCSSSSIRDNPKISTTTTTPITITANSSAVSGSNNNPDGDDDGDNNKVNAPTDTNTNDSEVPTTTIRNKGCLKSGSTSISGNTTTVEKATTDKYVYSGVGRHYGKTISLEVLDDGGDGASVGGRGQGGGRGGGLECCGIDILGYLQRLKSVSVVFLATLLILSSSSLLFVFPIIVDPIVLGFEAQFSLAPVSCRTISVRAAHGASECIFPSCRSGCTADVFNCTYIEVEYEFDESVIGFGGNDNPHYDNTSTKTFNDPPFNTTIDMDRLNQSTILKNGTLYININGCGYPPEVNCSEFVNKYGKMGALFPCHFSAMNYSIVVPNYSYIEQKRYLLLALLVPICLAVGSALALLIIIKCCCNPQNPNRNRTLLKESSSLKLILDEDDHDQKISSQPKVKGKKTTKGPGQGVNNSWREIDETDVTNGMNGTKDLSYMNGNLPKANGHAFQDTLSGLMGLKAPTEIHESIKKLNEAQQHQESFDKSNKKMKNHVASNGNGTPGRTPRYAKKSSNSSPNKTIFNRNRNNHEKEFTEDEL